MIPLRVLAAGVLLAIGGAPLHAADATPAVVESTLDGGRFGVVYVFRPATAPTNVALLFSGDGGWKDGVAEYARRLAREGFLVAGVDNNVYIASIAPRKSAPGTKPLVHACIYMAGDVEALSQHLQWAQKLPNYLRPVLFGYSAGASVVYTTLAQSPRGTFAGGVSLSFCAEMETAGASLCPGAGLRYAAIAQSTEVSLQPDPKLAFPWTIVHGGRDTVCEAAQTRSFVTKIPAARLIALPRATHDLTPIDAWWPRLRQDYRAMLVADTATEPAAGPPAGAVDPHSLDDLPLTEVPATAKESDTFAVMISGDGGWAGLDQGVSGELAAHGIPVVGLNSLKYFWHTRTADSTAADVTRIVEQYAARWHKTRVLLVGYSFGADVMPFVFNRLPAATRSRVASVSLLGLGPAATFEVTVGEWLPGADDKGDPVVPEIMRMPAMPVLCVMGAGEKGSSCPKVAESGVTVRQIGDGHHFSGLAPEIALQIMDVAAIRTDAAK
ncbi:MAG TPA: AcvB/VirJ family lysyl-phosphatidylglycerol hydrolase [Steroidobacteraceae bacterium]|jgi:type IV secretory pathway VirJ component|nr:AcvB/VirJ family lysyl-phosphatidylglycerol hydrolase [Steroidobacteraceae bacterium]